MIKFTVSIGKVIKKILSTTLEKPDVIRNTLVSEACGFVLQYVYEPNVKTFVRLLADSYPYCERSTKCSVPFVRKEKDGFAFGDVPIEMAPEETPEGQRTHIVKGVRCIAENGGGGMYNNAINQARISKVVAVHTGTPISEPTVKIPLVMEPSRQEAFVKGHDGIGVEFEFIEGKPREAHIISIAWSDLHSFITQQTDDKGEYHGEESTLRATFRKLKDAGLSKNEIAEMTYRNIHDKLPHFSSDPDRESVVDFAEVGQGRVVINNMPPGTKYLNMDQFDGEIEFRIGSNQLAELKEEVGTGVVGPVSDLLSRSSIVFLNAEEAHKLFGMPYTGSHDADVTEKLAAEISSKFRVPEVVISDEGRPVTYLVDGLVVQEDIPSSDSAFSEKLYKVLRQGDPESRVQNPTGCGDTLAPALQISKKIPALNTPEKQLGFAIFWASVVYRIPGSNLKDLPDDMMHDLMSTYFELMGTAPVV